jgi:hypothetical protein
MSQQDAVACRYRCECHRAAQCVYDNLDRFWLDSRQVRDIRTAAWRESLPAAFSLNCFLMGSAISASDKKAVVVKGTRRGTTPRSNDDSRRSSHWRVDPRIVTATLVKGHGTARILRALLLLLLLCRAYAMSAVLRVISYRQP